MKTLFIDSNVLLRFFTVDDAGKNERATELLKSAAEGKVRLLCGPPVFFEVAWTLRAAYGVSPVRIMAALQMLFALPNLEFTDRNVVAAVLTSSSLTDIEFADAYIAASVRSTGCDGVATFNAKDFRRLGLEIAEF
jgi:predicted nucleic acid-binding protein